MDEALQIAQTVADTPEVKTCIAFPSADCDGTLQDIADRIQRDTKTDYVVIVDKNRIRHTHPNAGAARQADRGAGPGHQAGRAVRPGQRRGVGERPGPAATGRWATRSAQVSVGRKVTSVTSVFIGQLPVYAAWFGVALGVGALASYVLARRLKKRTFGLELDEIAKLLQEREAVLHGIREGMIAFDRAGRVTMVNDEARRLLGLPMFGGVGGYLEDVVPAGRLRDLLSGEIEGKDQVVLTDEYYLTVNRMPVTLAGRPHGAVVTLRDRTELSGLLRELDSVTSLTDALRAQQHEFSNRMHTVAGLLELGETEEALQYLTDLSGAEAAFAESVRSRIAPPVLVGLILAKAAVAGERGVELELTEDTWLGDTPDKVQALTTMLGNLIDNAFDAVSGPGVDPRQAGAGAGGDRRGRRRDHRPGRRQRPRHPGRGRRARSSPTASPPSRPRVRCEGVSVWPWSTGWCSGSEVRITATEGPGAVFTVRLPKAAGDRGTLLSAGGGARSR